MSGGRTTACLADGRSHPQWLTPAAWHTSIQRFLSVCCCRADSIGCEDAMIARGKPGFGSASSANNMATICMLNRMRFVPRNGLQTTTKRRRNRRKHPHIREQEETSTHTDERWRSEMVQQESHGLWSTQDGSYSLSKTSGTASTWSSGIGSRWSRSSAVMPPRPLSNIHVSFNFRTRPHWERTSNRGKYTT
ncbi:hypothetical protein LZ32DRAFT_324737 [Colletotrichum eremochloae]|nr:hypothetical protein LZ32DRAFT_324737 [Colletotrichum eremochloae]